MEAITIRIYEASEGGYMYDIYDRELDDQDLGESVDGGHCTTTMQNALEMATSQARELIESR